MILVLPLPIGLVCQPSDGPRKVMYLHSGGGANLRPGSLRRGWRVAHVLPLTLEIPEFCQGIWDHQCVMQGVFCAPRGFVCQMSFWPS